MSDRVVGLGAWCDYVPDQQWLVNPGAVSIEVREFADLADGRRIVLHDDRGFGMSGPIKASPGDPLAGMTAADLESNALSVVLPDDDDSDEEHPYEWLAELLTGHGVGVTGDELRAVPYVVELSDRIRDLLSRRTA